MKLLWYALAVAACKKDEGVDGDGDGFTASEDCDDSDSAVHPYATEHCNGVDDNCDGDVDEGVLHDYRVDADGDGYGSDQHVTACAGSPNTSTDGSDCDDSDPDVHPKADEICANGIDDDCEGGDLAKETWYADADADGYGDPKTTVEDCTAPDHFVGDDSDCDDDDDAVHPGADELCTNAIDDDCDGDVASSDEGDGDGWYADACVGGYDCDDANKAIHPEAPETCDDAIDSDCDGADGFCGFTGTYDLADASAPLECDREDFDAGRLVEAGDVTGDGIEDILVATLYGDGGFGGGYVVPGVVAPGTHTLDDVGHRIGSVEEAAGAGRSIAIGDIDGDGIGDVGFGCPYAAHNGQYILFGPVTADMSLGDADLSLTVDRYLYYAGHGTDLSDVDGDGFDDAIVGEFWNDRGGFATGTVYVTYGPITGGDLDLDEDADVTIAGADESAWVGRMIRAGHDIDGDGIDDIAVNAINDSEIVPGGGGVWVVYGPPAIDSMMDADGWLAGTVVKSQSGAAFTVGDYDGDGKADVATWVWGVGVAIVNGPASGTHELDSADAILEGGVAGNLGSGLGSGDVDDDGIEELLVGDPGYGVSSKGATYLVTDPPPGTSDVEDIARATFEGVDGDVSGQGATVGDVDGDGLGDVLIGAPGLGAGGGVYVEMHAP